MKPYRDKDWLSNQYINNELSISQIANKCGVTISLIHRYLIRFDIPRRPAVSPSGAKSGQWKGGRTRTKSGYIWIHIDKLHIKQVSVKHRYVPEQILVMEKHLNRLLRKEEIVHHINEIKDDNRIENLYLFPNESKHQRYHEKLRRGSGEPIIKSNIV